MEETLKTCTMLQEMRRRGFPKPYYIAMPLGLPVDMMWQAPNIVIRYINGVLLYACSSYQHCLQMRMRRVAGYADAVEDLTRLLLALHILEAWGERTELSRFEEDDVVVSVRFPMQKNFIEYMNWPVTEYKLPQ